MKKIKLIIHVGSSDQWHIAAQNSLNFIKSVEEQEELLVRIVANNDAVTRCIKCDRPLFDKLKQIVLDGGEIFVCESSLNDNGINKERLPEFFKTVPLAAKTMAEWQQQGWAYIKP